ncbi:unnamed protein product [Danaus chrysippus]|uniref:(African queen) hypothetical protein n=1 Tax=Danaus chrysippus TaxID=151541 RepID=A0A8J2QJ38_9NEOP|nr:unnamed protein product [Danaus chrysippus]
MLESEENWRAMTSFCEVVLMQKEEAERVRESNINSDQMRRRRLGVRRRRYAPPPSAHLGGQRVDWSGDRPPCCHWPPGGRALKFTGAPSHRERPALGAGRCRRGYEVECASDPL